tara:strand:+ start:1021 stop:1203 length:183 start_codon:yes stop_codon:yes gene_type:complete
MNFLDWMNMNMIVDIAFLVFSGAIVWKFRKTQKQLIEMRRDLDLVMRNPQAAKRLLKERK